MAPRTYYGGAWSSGSDHFFYTVHDDAYRPFQVWRHALGAPVADDVLVLEEPDERFELNLRATRSGALVVIWAESRDTREVWVVDAASPTSSPLSVGGRRPGIEYHAEHVVLPDGDRHAPGGHQRRRHRVPARALPGAPRLATRTTRPGRPPGPSGPTSASSGWTGSPDTPSSASGRRPSTGCACVPLDALDGDGFVIESGVRLRRCRDRAQHGVRRRRR